MIDLNLFDFFAFDFDGTLVDSHPVYKDKDRLYVEHFYHKDISGTVLEKIEQQFRDRLGTAYSIEYYLHLDSLFGTGSLPENTIRERLSWVDENLVKPHIKLKPGADKLLNLLKNLYPQKKFMLVTGSKRHEIDYFSSNPRSSFKNLFDLNTFFDCIITQDDVIEQKPSPEPYRKALAALGATSDDRLLVFEDSIEGVISARANNATVIAIENLCLNTDHCPIQDLSDYYFKNWEEFLDFISESAHE